MSKPIAIGILTDVISFYWAAARIEQLASEGITGGCATGNYCPDGSLFGEDVQYTLFNETAWDTVGTQLRFGRKIAKCLAVSLFFGVVKTKSC